MGKKVDGKLQREKGEANALFLLYLSFHAKAKTPLLVHENLRAFGTDYMAELAQSCGYQHLGSILTDPADAGLTLNARKRK